jgi:XTP/dITP diphosphohydrolase
LASRNPGKLRELAPLLAEAGWDVVTLDDTGLAERPEEELLEAHPTFEDNALAKARYFAARLGSVVLADDSGLEVDALDGRPGVHSKRWSERPDLSGAALDAENNAQLQRALAEAQAMGRVSRAARYVCAAACVWPAGELVVLGTTDGVVLDAPRGASGFGYDPYLWSPELGCTFAEVTRERKAEISHRGRAFRALLSAMRARDVASHATISTDLAEPVDPERLPG